MNIPRLAKILVAVHTVLAFVVFLSVWANVGGYQNGMQWSVMSFIDFPILTSWAYLPEGQSPFNPALMSDMALNWLMLGYALIFGSCWWAGIGWVIQRLYEKSNRAKDSARDR
jgi:hypothetical protein